MPALTDPTDLSSAAAALDRRSRAAAHALREAAAGVEVPALHDRSSLSAWRGIVALAVLLAGVIIGASIGSGSQPVPPAQESPQVSTAPSVPEESSPSDPRHRLGGRVTGGRTGGEGAGMHEGAPGPARAPDTSSLVPAGGTAATSPPSATAAACDPLITDPRGDVDNRAIDILESSIMLGPRIDKLQFRHWLFDLPPTPPGTNEGLTYIVHFRLEGTPYRVIASFSAGNANIPYFAVQRASRTEPGPVTDFKWEVVTYATGEYDGRVDTVTVDVDLDDFNAGEQQLAASEGMAPAAELKRGSTLFDIELSAWPYTHGGLEQPDRARACGSYVVDM